MAPAASSAVMVKKWLTPAMVVKFTGVLPAAKPETRKCVASPALTCWSTVAEVLTL